MPIPTRRSTLLLREFSRPLAATLILSAAFALLGCGARSPLEGFGYGGSNAGASGMSSSSSSSGSVSNSGAGGSTATLGSGGFAATGAGGSGTTATGMVTCETVKTECNTPPQCGSQLEITQVPQPLPMGQGGTVLDGIYVATAFDEYTGFGGPSGPITSETEAATFRIAAGSYASTTTAISGTATTSFGSTGAIEFNGTSVFVKEACPSMTTTQGTYSVVGNTLSLFNSSGASKKLGVALVFTKL